REGRRPLPRRRPLHHALHDELLETAARRLTHPERGAMPIPEPNTAWPPAPWDYAYRTFEENDAWYTGDTDRLERIYRREHQAQSTHVRRGQPMRGGLVGAASRMFWGRPVPAGENRSRLHIPAAADLATLAS